VKFPESLADKKKLTLNEEKIVLFKLLHRNTHHVVAIDEVNTNNKFVGSMALLRDNYNEGRHGSWNNYAPLSKTGKGTYVKTTTNQKKKLID